MMFAGKSMAFLNNPRVALQLIRLIFLGITIGSLTSCQSMMIQQTPTPTLESSLMDQSLLNDQPCSAPCWYHLAPGKSSKAEVISTLKSLPFANPNTIHEKNYGYYDASAKKDIPAKLISIDCKTPAWQCAGLVVANDTLVGIGLFPNYELNLRQVVDHLDPPEFIRAVLLQDRSTCKIILSWVERQITLESDNPSGEKICDAVNSGKGLDPDLRISRVYYNLPDAFDFEKSHGKPWPGFLLP